MNNDYEELPDELKALAKKYQYEYDKGYDYIADLVKFLDWERKQKGLTGYNFSSFSEDANRSAFNALSPYSPFFVSSPTNGVFF